eukprot:TRINITY_DN2584_c0_g1_i1.p2 TRINITY_DN2584_c0_g1~~TRINITY_DN2584_c0_g1_i1.p2  ORF type:complete len:124 (-),score=4.84 TRINITY_DN2584_c0_g1_i1:120-491(-)
MHSSVKVSELMCADLEGFWEADFGPNGIELLEICRSESDVLVARKVTGDEHVPGGQVSFEFALRTGDGRIQIAQRNFRDREWKRAIISQIQDHNHFVFTWYELLDLNLALSCTQHTQVCAQHM